MKKSIVSLFLSVALCLSLCIPAFAEAAEKPYTGIINDAGTEMSFTLTNGEKGTFGACSFIKQGEKASMGMVTLDNNGHGTVKIPGDPLEAGKTFTVTIPGYAIITGTREAQSQSFTVTFDSQGGSSVASVTVAEGGKVSKPADPTRSGYTFKGWYTEAACTTPWNFDTDTVSEDITLYAKWEKDEPSDTTTVRLDKSTLSLKVGQTGQLTATVTPAGTKYTWSSSDEKIATVDQTGKVTALAAGKATITVTTADGKTDSCAVTVTSGGGNTDKPGGNTGGSGSSSGSHGSGNVGKPGVVGGNQNGGNQGGDQPPTGAFSDVQSGAYYADAVQWAVNQGITTGTTGTTFSPNNPCTRAQIVTFLWRANGSPAATGENPFTDVAQGAYYYDAVLWAVEKGITTGTTATTFSPNNTCTRAQAVTFLHRSAGTPAGGGTNPFTDVGTDAYYTNAVLWAVEKGVTGGTTATTFSPNSTCTRAQIVTFLYRAQ